MKGGGGFGLDAEMGGGASSSVPAAGGGLGALAASNNSYHNAPGGNRGHASPARSMSDDEAAVAIQSSYRGYKTRKTGKSGLGDFRREATDTLMERQSKARIAEMQGVDPYAATRGGGYYGGAVQVEWGCTS